VGKEIFLEIKTEEAERKNRKGIMPESKSKNKYKNMNLKVQ
jgi:hypothetical protein